MGEAAGRDSGQGDGSGQKGHGAAVVCAERARERVHRDGANVVYYGWPTLGLSL